MINTIEKPILEIFKLEEIIDLLVEYEVKKFEVNTAPIFNAFLYGFTDLYNKEIYVYKNLSYKDARETIIHEFVHALKDKYGIKDSEKQTTQEAKQIYKKLYENRVYTQYITGDKNGNQESEI